MARFMQLSSIPSSDYFNTTLESIMLGHGGDEQISCLSVVG
jgi:hypothetical protein